MVKQFSSLLFILGLAAFIFSCQSDKKIISLEEVAQSEKLWTGVAVSESDRIFVNYPRWSPQTTISVAEVISNDSIIPYPDQEWNQWNPDLKPEDHFVCVQSVYIDRNNFLWILDFFRGWSVADRSWSKSIRKVTGSFRKYHSMIRLHPKGVT